MKKLAPLFIVGLLANPVGSALADIPAPEAFHYKNFKTPAEFQKALWDYADAHDGHITSYDPALKRLKEKVMATTKKCHPKPDDPNSCSVSVVPESFRASLATIPLPQLFMMNAFLEGGCRGSYPDEPRHAPSCEFGGPVEIALETRGWCSSMETGKEGNWVACRDDPTR